LIAALAAAALTAAAGAAPAAETRSLSSVKPLEAALLAEVNALRRSKGVPPLRAAPTLAAAATAHSRAMATRGFFAHASPDGTPFWRRISRFYVSQQYRSWSVGENLAFSSSNTNAKQVLRMWLDSPPHRKNLLDPKWREIGISAVHTPAGPGVFRGNEVVVVTAAFGVRR
jgi:uncharacterized protein YkwD